MTQKVATEPKMKSRQVTTSLGQIATVMDFKSNESFFRKDLPDEKSEFGFAERNAKSMLRSKICFWIHQK